MDVSSGLLVVIDGAKGLRSAVNKVLKGKAVYVVVIPDSVLHYKIEKKLGEGGMGAVFLATDTHLDRKVALKFLSSDRATDSESRQRFMHEAKAEARVCRKIWKSV